MVSFQCDGCADTVKKPQLDKHRQRCWSSFTCLDCSTTFSGTDYKSHTSCISEAEKYQGALYKGAKKNGGHAGNQQANNRFQPYPASKPVATSSAEVAGSSAQSSASVDASPAPTPAPAPMVHPSRAKLVPASTGPSASATASSSSPAPSAPDTFQKSYQRGGARGSQAFPPLHPPARYAPKETNGYRGGPNAGTRGPNRKELTGMNMLGNPSGMRSWGTTPVGSADGSLNGDGVGEGQIGAGDVDMDAGGTGKKNKKKKVKKGDKGGTGSRAGISSKVPAAAIAAGGRKLEDASTPASTATNGHLASNEASSSSTHTGVNPFSAANVSTPTPTPTSAPADSATSKAEAKAEKKARKEREKAERSGEAKTAAISAGEEVLAALQKVKKSEKKSVTTPTVDQEDAPAKKEKKEKRAKKEKKDATAPLPSDAPIFEASVRVTEPAEKKVKKDKKDKKRKADDTEVVAGSEEKVRKKSKKEKKAGEVVAV